VETGEMQRRVLAGEPFDVVIAPRENADQLVKAGKLMRGTAVMLARISFGLAIAASRSRPDVGTPEALKRTLLAANTVIISDPAAGAIGGVHFMEILKKLGIVDQMKDKLVPQAAGEYHAERVAKGQADFAVQAEHLIRCAQGATFLDYPVVFRRSIALMGHVGTATTNLAAAKSYLAFITGPGASNSYSAHCLKPPAPPT
jgi:molybdate transport system substrate-binding protein